MATHNRWVIAAAGVVMQIALGAVYAWSLSIGHDDSAIPFLLRISVLHFWRIASFREDSLSGLVPAQRNVAHCRKSACGRFSLASELPTRKTFE